MEWSTTHPEEIVNLRWMGSANLTNTFGYSNQERFSYTVLRSSSFRETLLEGRSIPPLLILAAFHAVQYELLAVTIQFDL